MKTKDKSRRTPAINTKDQELPVVQQSKSAATQGQETAPTGEALEQPNNIQLVNLDWIALDADTQSRPLNDEVVAEYCELWKNNAKFPPVIIYNDGKQYLLTDGFHRFHGAKLAGIKEIPANMHFGTRLKALAHALAANAKHGLRRTIEDKRYAVDKALVEFAKQSDRAIAEMCAVSHTLVSDRRNRCQESTGNFASSNTRRQCKDGKMRNVPVRAVRPMVETEGRDNSSEPPQPGRLKTEPGLGPGIVEGIKRNRSRTEASITAVGGVQTGFAVDQPDNEQKPNADSFNFNEYWHRIEQNLLAELKQIPTAHKAAFAEELRKFADRNCV